MFQIILQVYLQIGWIIFGEGGKSMNISGLSYYNTYFQYTSKNTDSDTGNTETFTKAISSLAEKETATMNTANACAIDIYQAMKKSSSYSSPGEILSLREKTEVADAYQQQLEDAKVNDPEKYQSMILKSKEDAAKSFSQLLDVSKSNGGTATHNGVSILFDTEKKQMNIGDTSHRGNVISVNLSNGWVLNFNRDNIDDVSKILDLFSPEDIRRIMEAITKDKMAQTMEQEIDDTEASVVSETADTAVESEQISVESLNEDESEVKTEIVTNPDGSRNLMITTKIGNTETVTNIKLAPAAEENKLLKNQSYGDDCNKPTEFQSLHALHAYEANLMYAS